MKRLKFTLLFFMAFHQLLAQKPTANDYAAIDKLALQLPDSLSKTTGDIATYIKGKFNTDHDKSRAIFIWVASSIQYDFENMFAINFYEKKEEKISKPLKTRKGICENYASLFTDICTKSGIQSYVVEGYTKQNGFTDYIPHAWCAALIDTTWYLFDPTWGSGYVSNAKFYKKINNNYFKVSPATLIKSHMPFDYLWQFLYYPITNQEFYEGKTQVNKSKAYFNFIDSLKIYESQDNSEKMIASAYRVEKNGVKNSMVFDRLQHLKMAIENDRQTKAVNLFNSAVGDYNEGVNAFNEFINYRNKQFTPAKSDIAIQSMIDFPDTKIKDANTKLGQIQNPDANTTNLIIQLNKSIADVTAQLKEQQDWLKLYFSKNKSGRKSMFYKTTWMGIPLN